MVDPVFGTRILNQFQTVRGARVCLEGLAGAEAGLWKTKFKFVGRSATMLELSAPSRFEMPPGDGEAEAPEDMRGSCGTAIGFGKPDGSRGTPRGVPNLPPGYTQVPSTAL